MQFPDAQTQGRNIDGYQLLRKIGAGGMSAVYEALNPNGVRVALKLLHPALADSQAARERLRREVAMLQRVRGEYVAQILDAELTGENLFIVTELIDGLTLDLDVRENGRYTAEDLWELAQDLEKALLAVHCAGVLHRDLKPANVMLRGKKPVLIDFGISQLGVDARLTQTGFITHTPGFCDPRVLKGAEPDTAADWWGLAAVLAYAATGVYPFGKGLPAAVMQRVLHEVPDLPRLAAADAAVFARALTPELEQRISYPQLCAALADHDLAAEYGANFLDFYVQPAVREELVGKVQDDTSPAETQERLATQLLQGVSAAVPTTVPDVPEVATDAFRTAELAAAEFSAQSAALESAAPDFVASDFAVPPTEKIAGASQAGELGNPPTQVVPAPRPAAAPSQVQAQVQMPTAMQDQHQDQYLAQDQEAYVQNLSRAQDREVAGYYVPPLPRYVLLTFLTGVVSAIFALQMPLFTFFGVVFAGIVFGVIGALHLKLLHRRIRRGRSGVSDTPLIFGYLPLAIFQALWRSLVSGFCALGSGIVLLFIFAVLTRLPVRDFFAPTAGGASAPHSGRSLLAQFLHGLTELGNAMAPQALFAVFFLALFVYWVVPSAMKIRHGFKIVCREIAPTASFHLVWVLLLLCFAFFGLWFGAVTPGVNWWPVR